MNISYIKMNVVSFWLCVNCNSFISRLIFMYQIAIPKSPPLEHPKDPSLQRNPEFDHHHDS